MRVLIVGHWDLTAPDLAGGPTKPEDWGYSAGGSSNGEHTRTTDMSPHVLDAISRGIAKGAGREVKTNSVVLGPAYAFHTAVTQSGGLAEVIGRSNVPGTELAQSITEVPHGSGPLYIEAGHNEANDWGLTLLNALASSSTGQPSTIAIESSESDMRRALEDAQAAVENVELVLAPSSSRPLIGVGATSALTPNLGERTANLGMVLVAQNQARYAQALQSHYAKHHESSPSTGTPTLSSDSVVSREGSGVGAGAGALLIALGARLETPFEVLTKNVSLEEQIEEADLVVVVEPRLDGPDLAESVLQDITTVAGRHAKPVVAASSRTSLSRPERADYGLHGVSTLNPRLSGEQAFEDVGRRIGQTWVR